VALGQGALARAGPRRLSPVFGGREGSELALDSIGLTEGFGQCRR
jgi:hypothetical protein